MLLIAEYSPIPPMQIARIAVRAYNQPAHNASRRKVKAERHSHAPQSSIHISRLPFRQRYRRLIRQELWNKTLRGCITAKVRLNLVTKLETFHQPQENAIQSWIITPTLLIHSPDARQIGMCQNTI